MRAIYKCGNRGNWSWLFLSVGVLFVGGGVDVLITSVMSISTLIGGLGILGLGAYVIGHEIWRHRRVPFDVCILDNSAVQIRARYGTYVYTADQLAAITHIADQSNGRLILRSSGQMWCLPCSNDEGDNVIAAVVALNPLIRVELRADGGP